jgi:enoyl-CoA hydratase
MEYEQIRYERRGPVAVITIDRPERMNAIGAQTSRELIDAWTRFRDDDEALVAVLTGAGERAFSAGGDLKSHLDGEPVVPTSAGEIEAHNRGERDGILGPSRWTDIHKPTIAAVNGVAYAGGLEWVCWCHLAIADEHATFGVTCRRWNIGLADGRVIDAAEALEIGLVNEVVATGTCLERAVELANGIAALPQPAIRTDLEAAERGWGRPLDEGLRIEAECFNRLLSGSEILEGVRRFNDRNHPDRDPSRQPTTPGLRRS